MKSMKAIMRPGDIHESQGYQERKGHERISYVYHLDRGSHECFLFRHYELGICMWYYNSQIMDVSDNESKH
jgi:hypothetical protein